jgi:repressor LexA
MGRKPILTKAQVLVAIQRWLAEHGTAPSIEELRRELRVGSTRTVFRYLRLLEEERLIQREPGRHGLRVLKPKGASVRTRAVPIVGQIPAGPLMLAEENIEGWIRLPTSFASPPSDRFFLLRVRGSSMNRARVGRDRIEDGDLVLVRQRVTAAPGDIIVALVDGEATVKRFGSGPGYYVLRPDSSEPRHRPIVVDKDFRILGTVTRVLKKGSELLTVVEEQAHG